MKKTIVLLWSVLALMISWHQDSRPQTLRTGRTHGLGGSATGAMFGVQAPGWNPANLGLAGNPPFTLYLPASFGFSFGNNTFTPQYITQTFVEGDTLDQSQKEGIIDKLKSDDFQLHLLMGFPVLGFSAGNLAVNTEVHSFLYARMPSDLFRMALTGPVADEWYDLRDVKERSETYGVASMSLAKALTPPSAFEELSLGITFKYIYGGALAVLAEHEGHIRVTEEVIDAQGHFLYKQSTRGDGVGLDVGAAGYYQPLDAYLGLTLGNVIGSIRWTDVEAKEYNFNRLEGISVDSLMQNEYWKHFFHDADSTYSVGDLTTALPAYLMLSTAKYVHHNNIRLYAVYYQGLNESPAQSFRPRLSLGSEFYYLKVIPLRLGMAVGGLQEFELCGGFGLDLPGYNVNLGMSWQRGIALGAKGFSIALTHYIGADYTIPSKEKKGRKKPAGAALPVVQGAEATDWTVVTMSDLGLAGFDKGGENFRAVFDPLGRNPVKYPVFSDEPWASFFQESALLIGKARVALEIANHLKVGTPEVLSRYGLSTTKPCIPSGSPLYPFVTRSLARLATDLEGMMTTADRLINNAPAKFPNDKEGQKRCKAMIKDLKAVKEDLYNARRDYERFKQAVEGKK